MLLLALAYRRTKAISLYQNYFNICIVFANKNNIKNANTVAADYMSHHLIELAVFVKGII